MPEHLLSRLEAITQLRHLTVTDHFLTTYALIYALEQLDLNKVNEVMCVTAEMAAHAPEISARRVLDLRYERFGEGSRLD